MTKEEFNEKFESLLSDGFIEKYIREKKDVLLNSDEITTDLKNIPDNYLFPKTVLSICLERLSYQFTPIGCSQSIQNEAKKLIKKIKRFI